MIRKLGPRRYRVVARKKPHRNLGTFTSRGQAKRREEQVEWFKKRKRIRRKI